MATTAQLLLRLRDLLSEESADLFDDTTEGLIALNEGIDLAFSHLDVLPTTESINTIANTAAYTTTARLSRFVWVKLASTGTELLPLRADEFANNTLTYTTSGTPLYYCPEFSSTTGARQLTLQPTPSASTSDEIVAYFYALPLHLTTGASPQNPTWHVQYHFLPCYWAASELLRKDHRPEDANEMENKFWSLVDDYRRWYIRSFPYRPEVMEPVSNIGRPERAYRHAITE